MATVVTDPLVDAPADGSPWRMPAAVFLDGVERNLFPAGSRVYLWDGLLYTKVAKKNRPRGGRRDRS